MVSESSIYTGKDGMIILLARSLTEVPNTNSWPYDKLAKGL